MFGPSTQEERKGQPNPARGSVRVATGTSGGGGGRAGLSSQDAAQSAAEMALAAAFKATPVMHRALGWHHLLAALCTRAVTPWGQARALATAPLPNSDAVHAQLNHVGQARAILDQDQRLPLQTTLDIEPLVYRASKQAQLAADELIACAKVAAQASSVCRFLRRQESVAPALLAQTKGLADLTWLADWVLGSFESDGTLKDDASPALRQHRTRVRQLNASLRERMEAYLNDVNFGEWLQDNFYSLRNDRYVLPIRASFRSKVPGLVHNASQTGQTLFIEPQAIVPLGNELAIAQSLAAEEEARLLADMSLELGERHADFQVIAQVLGQLDYLQAVAELSQTLQAFPAGQAPVADGFTLLRARHPLLVLQNKTVVGNDLALGQHTQALVVSGPNAGGKTVSLTTVGLCALMARAGLPIPAGEGSCMPLYDDVLCVLGDAQSLSQDLSTFSAHVTALRRVLEEAQSGSLVLVDEIAADTDAKEGGALACAVLQALVRQRAAVMVTTHLEEVKALGLAQPAFANASVRHDPKTMRPTYQVVQGEVGASNALHVARQVGLPEHVVAAAEAQLHSEGGGLGPALAALAAQREALQQTEAALQQEREALAAKQAALQQTLADAQAAREQARERAQAGFDETLADAEQKVRSWIAELQARPTMKQAQKRQKDLSDLGAQQRRAAAAATAGSSAVLHGHVGGDASAQQAPKPGSQAAQRGPLRAGDTVKVSHLGQVGEVVAVDPQAKQAEVAMGALRMRLPLKKLARLSAHEVAQQRQKSGGQDATERQRRRRARQTEQSHESAGAAAGAAGTMASDIRCDVRGERAEEALRRVEMFLDQHYGESIATAIIVHGHGTGALKQAVRDALAASPYVDSFRPGDDHEGGDGVTIVTLLE